MVVIAINICIYFEDIFAYNGRLWRQNGVRGGAMFTPNELVFLTFGAFNVRANFGKNPSRNVSVRVHADGHTDTRSEANWFYNLSLEICYSYGTDRNLKKTQLDKVIAKMFGQDFRCHTVQWHVDSLERAPAALLPCSPIVRFGIVRNLFSSVASLDMTQWWIDGWKDLY